MVNLRLLRFEALPVSSMSKPSVVPGQKSVIKGNIEGLGEPIPARVFGVATTD